MNSLLLPSVSKAKQDVPSEDKQLMAMMEQNNAILAELSASISQLRKPASEPKVRFVSQNDTNQSSVAALARPHEKSDIQELKELLLDKIQSLDRHFEDWLEEIKTCAKRYTSKDKRGTATLFYLWTNWPSCNQLPRTQRAKPSPTASRIISRSQI